MSQSVLIKGKSAYNLHMVKPLFQVISQELKLPISLIEYDGLKILFKEPYIFTVQANGSQLIHENKHINLYITENTLEDLVESFFEFFCAQWRDIANANDNELHSSAIKGKKYLLSIAKEVQ